MDYKLIYESLVNRGKERTIHQGEYFEIHHIIPRCMGGGDSSENLVAFYPEEHYIAHLLLAKIFPNNSKIIFAANMMANRNNKTYGWIKRKFSVFIKEQNKCFRHSEIAKRKMSEKRAGVSKSTKHKENLRKSKLHSLEYQGRLYTGYEELYEKTSVSYYLYNKYYKKGIDPAPFINNNTYGMINKVRTSPARAAKGKKWFNDGINERYFPEFPGPPWQSGRLKKTN